MNTSKTTRHKWIAVGAIAAIASVGLVGCSSAANSDSSQAPSSSSSQTRAASTKGTQLTVTNASNQTLAVELYDGDATAPHRQLVKKVTLKKGQSVVGDGEARFNGSTCDVSAEIEPVGGSEGVDAFAGALPSLNGPLYFGEDEGVGCEPSSLMIGYQVGRGHSGTAAGGLNFEAKRLNETGDSLGNMHLTITN